MKTTYVDFHPDDPTQIHAGDILHTVSRARRSESWHRILDAWPTDSKIWPNRWTLKIDDRSDHPLTPDEGKQIHNTTPYTAGEGPREYFDVDI